MRLHQWRVAGRSQVQTNAVPRQWHHDVSMRPAWHRCANEATRRVGAFRSGWRYFADGARVASKARRRTTRARRRRGAAEFDEQRLNADSPIESPRKAACSAEAPNGSTGATTTSSYRPALRDCRRDVASVV
jgi:hypothetical protein